MREVKNRLIPAGAARVDQLGRVTIPISVRRALGIECKSYVRYCMEGNKVIIFKEPEQQKELQSAVDNIMVSMEHNEKISKDEYATVCEVMKKLTENIK